MAWQVCIGGSADHVDDLQSCFRLLLIGGGSQSQILNQWTDAPWTKPISAISSFFLSGYTFESQIPIRGECGNSVNIRKVDTLLIYYDIS